MSDKFLELDYHLNKFLSDLHIFKVKVHNLHWNLVDKNFFTIHPMLDGVMGDIDKSIDFIAEQIRMQGRMPFASLKTFLAHTVIQELPSKYYTGKETIAILHEDFKLLLAEVHTLIRMCELHNDEETRDILIKIAERYQMHITDYAAFLGR